MVKYRRFVAFDMQIRYGDNRFFPVIMTIPLLTSSYTEHEVVHSLYSIATKINLCLVQSSQPFGLGDALKNIKNRSPGQLT